MARIKPATFRESTRRANANINIMARTGWERTRRRDDGARDGYADQQKFGNGRREDSGVAGALQEDQSKRSHEVVESNAKLRARTGEYACPGTGNHTGGAGAQ